jgi:hypothetical protein
MKIGILTFHWATNYGAILQCLALQKYLISQGHDVEVINYKPLKYNDNLYNFIRFRKFLHLSDYINERKKEKALTLFRETNLKLTELVHSCKTLPSVISKFDVIISGSDQVVNPSFLMNGEGRNIISPTYYLGFPFSGKRVGYALSFGCVSFPESCINIASKYIREFNSISVRETSGVDIVEAMGRRDAVVVPDPTLLMPSNFYHALALQYLKNDTYIYSFFIRNIASRKNLIGTCLCGEKILWNNTEGDFSMEGWLAKIKNARYVITDSFHCVVMCLKLHKPFIVITERKGNVGMNDRLYTLLYLCGLSNRIIWKEAFVTEIDQLYNEIDWTCIDSILDDYASKGKEFLKFTLR